MTHQILIASYQKDFIFLNQCLRSIARFSRGFLPPVVVVEDHEREEAQRLCTLACPGAEVRVFNKSHGLGFHRAQIVMCRADEFCPDADYIYLVGSDCLFFQPFEPATYFVGNLPIMLHTSYAHLNSSGASNANHWQKGVKRALGFLPRDEFMRRLPVVYTRHNFPALRNYIELLHCVPFNDFVYSDRLQAHNNFSESNALGALAYAHHREWYHWVLTDNPGWAGNIPFSPLAQFWSHGGMDRPGECCVEYAPGKNAAGRSPRAVITDVLGSF